MLTIRPEVPENINISHLALGDSYTIGTAISMEGRWPVQLAKSLVSNGITITRQEIVATNGWTTLDLINGIEAASLQEEYDLVSLLIGVNNQYDGLPLEAYRTEFSQLLTSAIQYAGGDTSRVFVVSIPDYAFTPNGGGSVDTTNELIRFNLAAKDIADNHNVLFLNITPISQQAQDDPELVAADNLHPSGKQYGRWVREVIKEEVVRLVR
jgi:lysophospholipase L1-like esterase